MVREVRVLIEDIDTRNTYQSLTKVPLGASDEYLESLVRAIVRKVKEALNRKV